MCVGRLLPALSSCLGSCLVAAGQGLAQELQDSGQRVQQGCHQLPLWARLEVIPVLGHLLCHLLEEGADLYGNF